MNTGKNNAQSYEEMTESMIENRDKGVSNKRGVSIYKEKSGEYQQEKLRELVSAKTTELVEMATQEKVSLEDVETVKARTLIYLRACEETGTFPSSLGLARSLGYSDRALRNWRTHKPDSETARWLEIFNDLCADVMNESALKNNANSIFAIFLNKAMYGFVDKSELVVTPNTGLDDEVAYSVDDIKNRYLQGNED